jgi:hypothetical protein
MRRLGYFVASFVIVAAAAGAGGCSGPDNDPGLDALLRVTGAQFFRGAPPPESGGPEIVQLGASSQVLPGQNNGSLGGITGKESTAVIIRLDGDRGYWVLNPKNADATADFALTFSAAIQYSSLIPYGTYTMVGNAVDLQGHVGRSYNYKIRVADSGPPALPATLLVSLRWDTEADLDLHLVLPDGTEIFQQKVNSYSGDASADPTGYLAGGQLDIDSNATCVIDGRRSENIYWTQPPPSGHYVARVETYSLCSEFVANWELGVTSNDQTLGVVHALSREPDTLGKRGRGAGLTAIEFDIP